MGDFDKILKENIEQMLLAVASKYMGIYIKKISKLKEKIQLTEREVDFLAKVTNTDGRTFLLHIEFQTRNDPQMLRRIEEYHGFLRGKYDLEIEHFVVYLGTSKVNMKSMLPSHLVFKGFHLINLRDIDPETMIQSDIPEEVLLAILGQFRKQQSEMVVKQIITKLKALVVDEKELKKYVKHLTILARLRNFEEQTIKIFDAMPITYDIEQDALYKIGEQKGETKGRKAESEKKDTEFILSLLNHYPLWSDEQIAMIVCTDVKKVTDLRNNAKSPDIKTVTPLTKNAKTAVVRTNKRKKPKI
jgi:hypothetical protein